MHFGQAEVRVLKPVAVSGQRIFVFIICPQCAIHTGFYIFAAINDCDAAE